MMNTRTCHLYSTSKCYHSSPWWTVLALVLLQLQQSITTAHITTTASLSSDDNAFQQHHLIHHDYHHTTDIILPTKNNITEKEQPVVPLLRKRIWEVEDVSTNATILDETHINNRSGTIIIRDSNNSSSIPNNESVVTCRITMVDTTYMMMPSNNNIVNDTTTTTTSLMNSSSSSHDHTYNYHEHQVSCIPILVYHYPYHHHMETDDLFPVNLPESVYNQYLSEIRSGSLYLSISNATISSSDEDEEEDIGGITTTLTSQYRKLTSSDYGQQPHHEERNLQSTTSSTLQWSKTMTFAVIRISTSDSRPRDSLSTLKSKYSTSSTTPNFMKQYSSCSFGQMQWKLASAGVFDVQLPKSVASYGNSASTIVTAVQTQLKTTKGIAAVSDLATKIIMCLPPGTGTWAGSAGVKHWRIHLNSDWCTSLSGAMHEMGHTIGLLHAQGEGVPYNDRTGYMGSGYTDPLKPQKCFNAYNSYQFGWYKTRHLTLEPTTTGKLISLATFVDYPKTTSTESVIVNIGNTYYLLYNRQKGFNIGTEQKVNQVAITQKVTDGSNSVSGLSPGKGIYKVSNYKGKVGMTLFIEACYTKVGTNKAEIMVISVALNKSLCPKTRTTTASTKKNVMARATNYLLRSSSTRHI